VLASALAYGSYPDQAADEILFAFGPEEAGRVAKKAEEVIQALRKRLRNLKPDCPNCKGTGFATGEEYSGCEKLSLRQRSMAARKAAKAPVGPLGKAGKNFPVALGNT
jgi:hypothetical protein